MEKTKISKDVILVIGALGVGKSTISKYLAENIHSLNRIRYKHIDLDGYIGKLKKMEVKEYFAKVGYEKFYEESAKIISKLYSNHLKKQSKIRMDSKKTTLLIDVGSGSTFDYKSVNLTKTYHSILLTADPEYLFYREKCKTSHKELGYYKYWQFGTEKKELYDQCTIKIDVAYLSVEQIAHVMDCKIKNFQRGNYF
jgi:shikimate kinase